MSSSNFQSPQIPDSWRFKGRLPKVGIRPTIDGRLDGVRESLEDQAVALGKAVADLISNTLRHPSGQPVECVIPDHCIGGVAESAKVQDLFDREGVTISLTVTPCWCYGLETMDMDPLRPKAIWGFNGTERPGAVYLAATLAAQNQMGLPAFGIYGRDVQDAGDLNIPEDVKGKILRFVKAALAVMTMKDRSYLAVGGVSMGIAGSIVDQNFFSDYLGMRVESVDMTEVLRRIERKIYDEKEFKLAMKWVKDNCPEGKDYNPKSKLQTKAEKQETWETSVKMALIVRDLMVGNPKLEKIGWGEEAQGHNAIAGGFQGQRAWTDHLPNGDFMEAILTTSFDWNGIRQPYVLATENDCLNAVSMLFGHLLTGTAQLFADVRTYWSPEALKRVAKYTPKGHGAQGFLHLINSGPATLDGTGEQQIKGKPAMKPFWDITPKEADKCLKATTWHAGMREYFRGGGWSTRYLTKGGMPATICRLNLVRGLGPALQISEGYTVDVPKKVHAIIDERTNPTWPTTYFAPRTGKGGSAVFNDAYSVMNAWGSNHCAMSYGHIGADLISLASILRIPVYMHNVAQEKVFRPSAWTTFGTADLEGADFRACKEFGPLYR